ncbi:hypothetical protein MLD38_013237 [Melastoma candidum]|uniref:Uncharacterized protein n=1 Tax=Melastoma candidum TaxID=119954 RepID=A0ACB9R901_9MYRT|nr:hypothetical protein MLD38_013237 [Melastoma candidum]
MEPPRGFLPTLAKFLLFLPYFLGLLLLGTLKGVVICPFSCLILTVCNTGVVLCMWPVHFLWTYYSILRARIIGPILKFLLFITLPVPLILCPVVAILGSVSGGLAFGFLSPIFATFEAVGKGKANDVFHCFYDGTWSTIERSMTIVRDFWDICCHSYFSIVNELRNQEPTGGKYYEIRLLYLPVAVVVGAIGFMVDMPLITIIALCKSPIMLFKGWHRLFHDLIGREGPFLETICVPFAGLAIIIWPLAVAGAVLGSIVSSIFLGGYAGVVVYQESSLWFGLCYIVASLAIYDEYGNDILDMPEGSWFPKVEYRRNSGISRTASLAHPLSRTGTVRNPPDRSGSLKNPMLEINPLEVLKKLFEDCKQHGEKLVTDGLITPQDIEDTKSDNGSRVISTGLPAYCIYQTLLRSAKANAVGLLCRNVNDPDEEMSELTISNRPKDVFFDWFLSPLLIIKDQIKAENLTSSEEEYLGKLVLLCGDPARLKSELIGSPPESELKRAEFDALARRLQGITKSISRYPTFRRRFDDLVKIVSEDLSRKGSGGKQPSVGSKSQRFSKSRSSFFRTFSQRSVRDRTKATTVDEGPSEKAVAAELEAV